MRPAWLPGITARPGRLSRKGDNAMRNERSRTMVALPCGPVGIMHGPRRVGSVDGCRCRRSAGVRACSWPRGRPGSRGRHLEPGASRRLAPVPRRQRSRHGRWVLVRDCGGPAGLPRSVRGEDQAGGGGARGHRTGPARGDRLPRRAGPAGKAQYSSRPGSGSFRRSCSVRTTS